MGAVSGAGNIIPFWLVIVTIASFALSLFILTFDDAEKTARKKANTTKTPIVKNSKVSSRLDEVLKVANSKVNQKTDFYNSLGKEAPELVQIQQSIISVTNGKTGPVNTLILVISGILAIIVALTTFRYTKLASILLGLSVVLVAILFTSYRRKAEEFKAQEKSLTILNVLHSQYQTVNSFTQAIILARDIFKSGSYEYNILNNYYDRVVNLKMNRKQALDLLVADLGSNVQVKQYMELVEQTESVNSSYKQALTGIPANLKSVVDDKKVYMSNIVVTTYFMLIAVCVLLFILFVSVLINPQAYLDQLDIGVKPYHYAGITLFTLFLLRLTYSNRIKPEEMWGAK